MAKGFDSGTGFVFLALCRFSFYYFFFFHVSVMK